MNKLREYLNLCSTVIITGGSSGIGDAFINLIYNLNHRIHFFNLSRKKPDIFLNVKYYDHFQCDFSKIQQIDGEIDKIKSILNERPPRGKVLLINNSGFGSYGVFQNLSIDTESSMLLVNINAMVRITHALLPIIKKTQGAIINNASIASFQPTPFCSTYGASKSFVRHFSLSLSQEVKKDGVTVQCLCPGPTNTAFFRHAGFVKSPIKKGFGETADVVAWHSLKALPKGKILVISGWKNWILTALCSKLPIIIVTVLSGIIMRKIRLDKSA